MRNTTPTPIRPHQTSLLSDQAHPPSSPSLHTHPYSTKPLKPHRFHQHTPHNRNISPKPSLNKPIHTYYVDKCSTNRPHHSPTRLTPPPKSTLAGNLRRRSQIQGPVHPDAVQTLAEKGSSLKTSKWQSQRRPHSAVRKNYALVAPKTFLLDTVRAIYPIERLDSDPFHIQE